MGGSNTWDTGPIGSAVGNVETIAKRAYITSNIQTPVWSYLPKMKANGIDDKYILDDKKPVVVKRLAEGEDQSATEDKFKYQYKTYNYISTLSEDCKVTDLQQLVENATGVNIANAVKRSIEDLNLQSEADILGTQARSYSGGLYQGAGLAEQLGGSSSVLIDRYQTPAAQRPVNQDPTEGNVDNVLRSMADNAGKKAIVKIFAGSAWTSKFASKTARLSDSTPTRTVVNYDGGSGEFKNFVRRYEGQHGVAEVHDLNPNTCPDPTNKDMAYFLQDGGVHVKELKNLEAQDVPNLGGGPGAIFRRYQSVCVTRPREQGYWSGLAS